MLLEFAVLHWKHGRNLWEIVEEILHTLLGAGASPIKIDFPDFHSEVLSPAVSDHVHYRPDASSFTSTRAQACLVPSQKSGVFCGRFYRLRRATLEGRSRTKKSRFTDRQVAFALQQAVVGTPVEEVCRRMGVCQATLYCWKKVNDGLMPSEVRRLRHDEE